MGAINKGEAGAQAFPGWGSAVPCEGCREGKQCPGECPCWGSQLWLGGRTRGCVSAPHTTFTSLGLRGPASRLWMVTTCPSQACQEEVVRVRKCRAWEHRSAAAAGQTQLLLGEGVSREARAVAGDSACGDRYLQGGVQASARPLALSTCPQRSAPVPSAWP